MIKPFVFTSLAAAFAGAVSVSHAANITVATYGGEWGDTIRDCIQVPFEKATGHRVTPEPGVSAVTLAKLRQQTDNPSIDVAWLDGGVSELAAEAGVVAPLTEADIPGLANVIPEGLYTTKDGATYAVSTGYYAVGLVYDTRELDSPPTSWQDLWKEEFAGLVTVPSPGNAMGIPFLMTINKLEGGTDDDMSKGLAKIGAMDAFGYFDTSGNATNSFQSGEVVLGAHYASAAWALADRKLPIAYTVPKEGALGGDIRLHLVKNTSNAEAAKAFIDFAIQPEQAACMSQALYIGPATKGVELDDNAKERMPWGKNGSIDNLIIIDWDAVNARRSTINEQWNKTIAR